MNASYWVAVLGFVTVIRGVPMPQPQSLVPGVFIPADAFKNLQDRANANDRVNNPQPVNQGYQPNTNFPNNQPITNQGYPPNTNIPNSQPMTNQVYQPNANIQNAQPNANPSYQPNANIQIAQPNANPSYQPNTNIQNAIPNANPSYQPIANVQNPQPGANQGYQPTANVQTAQPNYQPVYSNQPQYQPIVTFRTQPDVNQPVAAGQTQPLIVDQISATTSNPGNVLPISQPSVIPINQPTSQPGQGVIYVQQQLPNQQTIYVPQSNQGVQQPIVFTQSPNQGYIVQNGQGGQPTKVVFGNQVQGQNPNAVYTLIPLNGQNLNSNTGTGSYLIPIQSGGSTPIVLNAAT